MEAPSIDELYEIMNLAGMANTSKKDLDVHGMKDKLLKMAHWLYGLAAIDASPVAKVKLAVETAEAALPNFEGMIAMSTAHVTHETRTALADGEPLGLTVYSQGVYGWLIHVASDAAIWADLVADGKLPPELLNCMDLVRKHGCCWLLLDADAAEIDGLTTFDG